MSDAGDGLELEHSETLMSRKRVSNICDENMWRNEVTKMSDAGEGCNSETLER